MSDDEQFLLPSSRTAGVIFSGIGGWEVGLQASGWKVAYSVENDPGKVSVLQRQFAHPILTTMSGPTLHNGLLVLGGLPSHECQGTLWESCMQTIYESEARWVVLETVHTLLNANKWPGAFARVQHDLHDAGYTTLWCLAVYGCQEPVIRWSRLLVIGWPMGWSIPVQLSACHGQALLMHDVEIGLSTARGQTYPRHDLTGWQRAAGFPAGWLLNTEPQADYLTVTTIPAVATNLGHLLMQADQRMVQLVEPEAVHAVQHE